MTAAAFIRSKRARLSALNLMAWSFPFAVLCLGCGVAQGIEIKSDDDLNNSMNRVIVLQFNGQFEQGDGLKVRAFVAKLPSDATLVVRFNSAGGSNSAAMSVGRFLHQLGVVTEVPPKARCLSPCPLAFFGGYDPKGGSSWIKHTSASFGFTPFTGNAAEKDYTVKDLDAAVSGTQQSILNVMDYLVDVNADLDVLRRIYEDIPLGAVHYVSDEDLLSLGVSIYDDKSSQLIDAQALQKRNQR
jgi:hypothetical protein